VTQIIHFSEVVVCVWWFF